MEQMKKEEVYVEKHNRKMKTEISVIVPVYNVEKYLSRCLKSILGQTFQNFEIICVDDCSEDSCRSILESFRKKDSRIKIITNERNSGLGQTRDNGLMQAQGEYVVFVDSDDQIKKDFLETMYREIKNGNYDIVTGGYILVKRGTKKITRKADNGISDWFWPSACGRIYQRKFLIQENINFRGVRTYEDAVFQFRILSHLPRKKTISYCGYYYVVREKSITQGADGQKKVEHFSQFVDTIQDVIDEEENNLQKNGFQDEFEAAVIMNLVSTALYLGKSVGSCKSGKIHQMLFQCIDANFPDYQKNQLLHFFHLPPAEWKSRYCTWSVLVARKMKLDSLLFRLIGLLP